MLERTRIKQRLSTEVLLRTNIGVRYHEASLLTVLARDTPYREEIRYYANNLDSMASRGIGLWLFGPNGSGKSYIAASVLLEYVKRGYTGYCISADELKAMYISHQQFDPDLTVAQRVETVEVLIIDDLGKEYSGKDFGWAELNFENLLRKRVRNMLVTVITTNLTRDAYKERYKTSAVSLVKEAMHVICVDDVDWRADTFKAVQKEFHAARK